MKTLLLAALALAAHAEPAYRVTVDRIEWAGLDSDRLRLAVYPRIETTEKVTLRYTAFEQMSIGGLPFYLSPPAGPIVVSAEPLPPATVTIYLRDFAALPAIRQMVESGRVSVRGEAHFVVELTLLARLLLFSSTANVAAPIDGEVPFVVPGGLLGRAAAYAAILTAQQAATLGEVLQNRLRPHEPWELQLRDHALPATFPITTTFIVDWRDTPPQTMQRHANGFLIAPGRILTPAEAVEPWRYDLRLATAIAQGLASVRSSTIQITATEANLRPIRIISEMEPVFVSLRNGDRLRMQLAKRAANRNLALLEITPPAAPPLVPVADPATGWDRLLILRPPSAPNRKPELIVRRGRREAGRIVFADPIDALALGSPVFSPAGLTGIVQNETSAAPVPNDFA